MAEYSAAGEALLARATEEGVEALLSAQLSDTEGITGHQQNWWRLQRAALVAADALRHVELQRLVTSWGAAPIDTLLLKGSGLAYTLYPAPWLRPQSDVDVWCAASAVPAMRASLEALGYADVRGWNNEGKHQFHYRRTDAHGIARLVEVHLQIANPEVFAGVLSFPAAAAAATPTPGLPGGRTLAASHALLHACVHRAAHHFGSRRLIWLYDIHLLAARLSAAEWSAFVDGARAGRVAAVCRDGLAAAASVYATSIPAAVDAALGAARDEPTRRFLAAPREVDVRMSTLGALPTWRARARHVRGWLVPPVAYMRARYAIRYRALLPFWYVYRVITRLPFWWRRYRP
ncbi:MAG: nucleotidyltransferase family protein [Vicinamibacterales bacterium]